MINVLYVALIVLVISIAREKNNFKVVLYYSAFSLISATLYFIYNSPDVALAEAAVGSALIPLIFIISISKQREFIVLSQIDDEFMSNPEDGIPGEGYLILSVFCNHYDLKLVMCSNDHKCNIPSFSNVDLMLVKSANGKYVFKGRKSSVLLNKLEQMTEYFDEIEVQKVDYLLDTPLEVD